eukprot:TRINITY_DN1679_c0_g1_i1.p1 TRINITY_DN1679_c0_g1~~TRINITY_DN1679_c0_g1_i1.p1  ORF type:complete len:167 (-),score=33.91 TRINITY_DN1679_c0_g1_i1:84-563(-)
MRLTTSLARLRFGPKRSSLTQPPTLPSTPSLRVVSTQHTQAVYPRVTVSHSRSLCTATATDPLDSYRRKLKWRCMERGMVENELILKPFALKHLPLMNEEQLKEFEVYLDEPDPLVWKWFTGAADYPAEYENGPYQLAPKLREWMVEIKQTDGGIGDAS